MKILHYSHDSFGLGHIRRTLAIVRQIAHDQPGVVQMVLTGSAQFGAYEWPPHVDCVKLPTLRKKTSGEYHSPHLHGSLEEVSSLRESIIMSTISHFNPDLVLVDKAPAGLNGEMVRPLHYLKKFYPNTLLVLGMRDIEDASETTRDDWRRENIYQLLAESYDAILVYGEREVFDPVVEYDLSPVVENKIYPCGYIFDGDKYHLSANDLRKKIEIKTEKLVLVTAGGGGDGFHIIKTYLDMLAGLLEPATFHSLIVTGPQMAAAEYQLLEQCAAAVDSPVTFKMFTPHLSSYLSIADLVVTMGGYNTVMEIMGYGRRAIIVPRIAPRREQLIRAERLAARNLVCMIHPDELSVARLFSEVKKNILECSSAQSSSERLNMAGAATSSRILIELLDKRKEMVDVTDFSNEDRMSVQVDGTVSSALDRRKNSDRRSRSRIVKEVFE